ncbi:MAG: hypothetical protein ABGX26_02520 [Nautiliaceae bacterium]|jgi:hypothetical protein
MKKLLLILSLITFSLANNISIIPIEKSNKPKIKYRGYATTSDKTLFFLTRYNGESITDPTKITKMKDELKTNLCNMKNLKEKIKNGYKVEIVYIYDNLIFRVLIDSCN